MGEDHSQLVNEPELERDEPWLHPELGGLAAGGGPLVSLQPAHGHRHHFHTVQAQLQGALQISHYES